jgi:esterase/lipase superfamily enzyme
MFMDSTTRSPRACFGSRSSRTTLSLPGVAVHYAWPSAGNPLGYIYDRDSALFARDGLEALIREVEAAGADQIVIVAHSLGSLVTMEALRQMAIDRPGSVYRRIDGVILISPDIDIDVFRAQAARIGRLPDPFGIFVSKRDRALALISRLAGQQNRLGNVANVDQVSDLEVTIIDVTGFSQGLGHFTPGTSPVLLQIFARAASVDTAFRGDASGRIGLLPGTVLTVQNATEIILTPVTGLARAVAQ